MKKIEYKRDSRSPVPKNVTTSKVMSAIKAKETGPEIMLRKALFKNKLLGYRKNVKSLPGKPDVVFTKKRVVIFVNGCYWHGCKVCGWKPPKHNTSYWAEKISKNRQRDAKKILGLRTLGYKVIIIWDHDLKGDLTKVIDNVAKQLQ